MFQTQPFCKVFHFRKALTLAGQECARFRGFLPDEAQRLDHVALAFFRHEGTGATEQELVIGDAPSFSGFLPFFRPHWFRDFHAFR